MARIFDVIPSSRRGVVAWMSKAGSYVIPSKEGIQTFICHAELVSASLEKYPEINSGGL
ncbi:hypothetical protein [Rickettsia endosymbiont of Orchestes rusci]|uniref:hypothetical protein n=1 Tax=Rickettsia endosymbiont of Orchestes rusci TaxID=3066250 RepID=UPI00313D38A3